MGTIYRELKQTEPFEHLEEEALVTLLRTSDLLRSAMERIFRTWNLSIEQYDLLRVLNRAPGHRLPCLELGSRILSRAPNITRLVDKLVRKGLTTRRREAHDRRIVTHTLTPEGRRVCVEASREARKEVLRIFAGASKRELQTVIDALDGLRDRALR